MNPALTRPLASLRKTALIRRPGYLQACLALGKLDSTGTQVEFTEEAWQTLRRDYALRGAGDVIQLAAAPIAKALGLDCHDNQTGDLKPESPCAHRRAAANHFLPFRPPQ